MNGLLTGCASPQYHARRSTTHSTAPLEAYAALDNRARLGLGLPLYDFNAGTAQLAHTIAYLMARLPRSPVAERADLRTARQERYLCACKDAHVDGGPFLLEALRAEHDGGCHVDAPRAAC